jgi:4-hydroxyphenylpyruvate dioxygenase-like putative hemolysin
MSLNKGDHTMLNYEQLQIHVDTVEAIKKQITPFLKKAIQGEMTITDRINWKASMERLTSTLEAIDHIGHVMNQDDNINA